MHNPSRNMPARRRCEEGVVATGGLTLLAILLVSPGLAWWPLAFVFPGLAITLVVRSQIKAKHVRAQRQGESICGFARAFDCRSVDTWIIRAVYEEATSLLSYPIRASDLVDHMDSEDLDELAADAATRSGRSLDDTESNPWYGWVMTYHDLILFLNHQPLLAATPDGATA